MYIPNEGSGCRCIYGRAVTNLIVCPMQPKKVYTVGVLSDTHGYLPKRVVNAFRGVDFIIHAGDIDRQQVLNDLSAIAPVRAVRGNMDIGVWAFSLPKTQMIHRGGVSLYVVHDLGQFDINPSQIRVDGVIYGHSHQYSLVDRNGIRFINPGSPTRPRDGSASSVAILEIRDHVLETKIVLFE